MLSSYRESHSYEGTSKDFGSASRDKVAPSLFATGRGGTPSVVTLGRVGGGGVGMGCEVYSRGRGRPRRRRPERDFSRRRRKEDSRRRGWGWGLLHWVGCPGP